MGPHNGAAHGVSSTVKACLIGQVLSLLLVVMGTTSSLLATYGVNAPTTQSFLNYVLLAISCGAVHVWRCGGRLRLSNSWLTYLILALLDVEGNYLVTRAYQYTSITSVTLLDSATIPMVMVLSALVFRSRYRLGHMVGCLLCTGGLVLLVLTDGSSETGGSNPLLGDALVLAGAGVYAVCNIAQEKLLSEDTSRWEMLAMLGAWASLICGTQAFVLERDAWQQATIWTPGATAAMLGFALSLYFFYLLVPSVLLMGSSTILNLSLLTSDLWAVVSRLVMFGGFGGTAWAFSLALAGETVGLVMYALSGETHAHGATSSSNSSRGGGAAPGGLWSWLQPFGPHVAAASGDTVYKAVAVAEPAPPAAEVEAEGEGDVEEASALGGQGAHERARLLPAPEGRQAGAFVRGGDKAERGTVGASAVSATTVPSPPRRYAPGGVAGLRHAGSPAVAMSSRSSSRDSEMQPMLRGTLSSGSGGGEAAGPTSPPCEP